MPEKKGAGEVGRRRRQIAVIGGGQASPQVCQMAREVGAGIAR